MKKQIFILLFLLAPTSFAATVEEIHVESFNGLELRTYRGYCEVTEEGFVVQREAYGFKYHGPAGIGITRNVRLAVQAACAEETVSGLEV